MNYCVLCANDEMNIRITLWHANPPIFLAWLAELIDDPLVFDPAAAAPESVSRPKEAVPLAGSFVRSGADASRFHSIRITALILTAAAAAAVVT